MECRWRDSHCVEQVRVMEVPLHFSSLNAGDVFVLDGWNTLWLWSGQEASEPEVLAARGIVQV